LFIFVHNKDGEGIPCSPGQNGGGEVVRERQEEVAENSSGTPAGTRGGRRSEE